MNYDNESSYYLSEAIPLIKECNDCGAKGQLRAYLPSFSPTFYSSGFKNPKAVAEKIKPSDIRIVRCEECHGTGKVTDHDKWYGYVEKHPYHHVVKVMSALNDILLGDMNE